jgi:hypothetical protein
MQIAVVQIPNIGGKTMNSTESERRVFGRKTVKGDFRKPYKGFRKPAGKGKPKCPKCGFHVRGPNHDCKRVTSHAGK